ncbi:protein split ends isoform X4 [Rhizophagus clarus]|uniref:Protein split ends isoform X4 n=1 Tax=Rhizophagus clarus TaxID=94130 RepID=A0A8H3L078_9GLOM|nr:protein split ends isoform X4 [Rhizophagus clarus]
MTKRRGVTEKDKATKAAKTTKTIRTYVANSSRDYNKERNERREEGSEHEQDNLHRQDVDIGEGNNRQDDDIERIILDMLPEQEERNIEKERRENEKKEMERRDKERREKERREKERREKERREKERRERDRREKDKEQEENENDESESEEEIPVQFGAMTNQLQICNWLVLHPSVLHLANKMLDASTKQPSTNLPLTTSTSSPSDNDNYRLIDEEMKCLFLRTRNPPDHVVAKSINERYQSGYTESSDPTDEEVNNFISREVVLKRILSRYVSAIDFTKLSETSLDKLIEFSRKCFKIVWVETESANIKEKVKELDVITEDLEIPSRSGRNIASSLKLHLFS